MVNHANSDSPTLPAGRKGHRVSGSSMRLQIPDAVSRSGSLCTCISPDSEHHWDWLTCRFLGEVGNRTPHEAFLAFTAVLNSETLTV